MSKIWISSKYFREFPEFWDKFYNFQGFRVPAGLKFGFGFAYFSKFRVRVYRVSFQKFGFLGFRVPDPTLLFTLWNCLFIFHFFLKHCAILHFWKSLDLKNFYMYELVSILVDVDMKSKAYHFIFFSRHFQKLLGHLPSVSSL